MSDEPARPVDPFRRCEESCTHELAMGVTVAELRKCDGPHKPFVFVSHPLGGGAAVLAALMNRRTT